MTTDLAYSQACHPDRSGPAVSGAPCLRAGPRSGGTLARFRNFSKYCDEQPGAAPFWFLKGAGFLFPSSLFLRAPLRSLRSLRLRVIFSLLCVLCVLCVGKTFSAEAQSLPRPKITGIASVRLYSSDLYASRAFYSKTLGFDSATSTCLGMKNPCYAVNGRQRIELQQIAGGAPDNLLAEIAFSTPDLMQLREYLLAYKIAAGPITKDETGTSRFTFKDPEGNPLAFVQPSERFFTPAAHQVSARILHAGFIVKDLSKEKAFYEGLLGFRLYWHGYFPPAEHSSSASEQDDWYEIQVPDGEEWIEFMLNISPHANKQERGVQNHFSLGVKNADNAAQHLRVNGAAKFDGPEVGRDGKNALDIYDPDLTRVEVMDYNPTKDPCCGAYAASHPKP